MASMIAAMKRGVDYPADMVAWIVADEYLAVLPFSAIHAIAENGLHGADREAIAETIETEGLGVTVAQVAAALVDACEARVETDDRLFEMRVWTD